MSEPFVGFYARSLVLTRTQLVATDGTETQRLVTLATYYGSSRQRTVTMGASEARRLAHALLEEAGDVPDWLMWRDAPEQCEETGTYWRKWPSGSVDAGHYYEGDTFPTAKIIAGPIPMPEGAKAPTRILMNPPKVSHPAPDEGK